MGQLLDWKRVDERSSVQGVDRVLQKNSTPLYNEENMVLIAFHAAELGNV
jgi:hypothetical protein